MTKIISKLIILEVSAIFVKEACEILSVNLVYLPPYCPFLSPIEDVWNDIKREDYVKNFVGYEFFASNFYRHVFINLRENVLV